MRIKKYNNYLVQSLLESILISSREFKQLLHDIPSDNKIADALFSIIDDNVDIKTTYNYIDQTDKNDEISFIPDNQFQRFKEKGDDIASKTKNKAKIGRMVRQILKDNGYNFSESDIEKFVNQFKSTWNVKHGVGRKIEVAKGDDIIYWYNEKNYFKGEGTLGNSCMRYEHKANFMRIYADNPDKISMITLRQDDKLLARALVWKLDDGRIYLDRIYAIQDSDFDFVYNWALQNIGGDNPSNMPSHYKGRVGAIKCSIDKAVEEEYPYADSMYYLFQELKDGQLTGKGYTSNEYNEYEPESYEGYLVRIIQNTDGGSSIQNYKYSDYSKKWILSADAVWASDVDSWVDEEITVHSSFSSERYLKDNCIYNEIVDDWFPKDDVVENEKYGLILPQMLKETVVAYTGKETDPLKIWFDMEENGSDVTKIIKELKNRGEVSIFRPDRSPLRVFYSTEFRVDDYDRDSQVNFLCYKLYRLVGEIPESLLFARFRYNSEWVTEIDAEIFGISVDKNIVSYVSAYDYMSRAENSIYNEIIKLIDKSNAPQNLKSQRIEIAEILHNYLMRENSEYRFNNTLATKIKDQDLLKFSIEIFNESYNSQDTYEYDGRNMSLKEYIDYVAKNSELGESLFETSEKAMSLVHKYFRLYVYLYSLKWDSYDASDILYRFIKEYNQEDFDDMRAEIRNRERNYDDNCFYLLRRITRAGLDYEIKRIITDKYNQVASDFEISISMFRSNFGQNIFDQLNRDMSPERINQLSGLVK